MKKIIALSLSFVLLGAGCAQATPPAPTPEAAAPTGQQGGQPTTPSPTPNPTPAAPKPAPAKTMNLAIISYQYSPATLKVKRGTKIIVTNKDGVAHTVTSNNNAFDSGELNFNESVTIDTTTLSPGSYPYRCIYHPEMKGTIVVE